MSEETAVLLGLFDGLHRGHRRAVSELMKQSGKKTVFTFDSASVSTKGDRGLLMTDSEKRAQLLKLGADEVISEDFSEYKNASPEEFVKNVLIDRLGAKTAVCGENFRFGKDAAAGAEELFEICKKYGCKAVIVPTEYDGGEPISTSRIRTLLQQGDAETANRLLGYVYSFDGRVCHGFRIGSQMGFKTINLPHSPKLVLPKKGVYRTETELCGEKYPSITNIGTRPTVHKDGEVVIETHVLDFDGDLYGDYARVGLLEFIRPEKRFESAEELKKAVEEDIEKVRQYSKNQI